MVEIPLDSAERQVLIEVLNSYLSDLRMEIADTDSQNYREGLKNRKQVVQKALEALRSASAESPL